MEDEDDYYLNELRKNNPLKSHWVKKDYIQNIESAIFVYYNIEPLPLEQITCYPEESLRLFDKFHIWDVLVASDLSSVVIFGKGVDLRQFVGLLQKKDFEIPEHLQHLLKPMSNKESKVNLSFTKDDLLECNFNKFTPLQLQRLHARSYAAIRWKDCKNKQLSANALVQTKGFKECMASIGAEDIKEDTQAEWISDLSPRSRQNR